MNLLSNKKTKTLPYQKENILEVESNIKHILIYDSIYIIINDSTINFIFNPNTIDRKIVKIKHKYKIAGALIANDNLIVHSNKSDIFYEYSFLNGPIKMNEIKKQIKEKNGIKKIKICSCKKEIFFICENIYCLNVDDYSFKYKIPNNVKDVASSCDLVYYLSMNNEILVYKGKLFQEKISLEDKFSLCQIYFFDNKIYAVYEDYLKIFDTSFQVHKIIKKEIKNIKFCGDRIFIYDGINLEEIIDDRVRFIRKDQNISNIEYDYGLLTCIGKKVFAYMK